MILYYHNIPHQGTQPPKGQTHKQGIHKEDFAMKSKSHMILLSASAYSMMDEETKRLVEGLSLFLYTSDDLTPCENLDAQHLARGNKPMRVNLPYSHCADIKEVPGLYECDLAMNTNSQGQASLKVTGVTFISALSALPTGTPQPSDKPAK